MGLNTFPCNPYPISTEELNKGNNDDLNARVATLEEEVTDLGSSIAPEFSTEAAYTAGDIVYHDGSLYEFTANHAAGAWSTSDTQAATVGGKITSLESDVTNLNSTKANQITIAPTFSAETAYDPGDLVYYNGLTYRCVNAHEGAWDADDFAATTIATELVSLMSGLKSGITGNFPVSYTQGWQIIKHITFDTPFGSVPAVVLQSIFTGGANGDVYEPANITVSGFDINMYSPSVGSYDYYNFCWIATA